MKEVIEAALFVSPRPLSIKELSELSGLSEQDVERTIEELKNSYSSIGSSILIEKIGDSYRMHVKPEVYEKVKHLSGVPEFTEGELKVVAYIFGKESVKRSELKKKFRSTDSALEKLNALGLIVMKKKGNTYEVIKTPLFEKYFKIS